MNLFVLSTYVALCILLFAMLRIPLNRWTVPSASIGGLVSVFMLVQTLNYFHPYSNTSRQVAMPAPSPNAFADAEANARAEARGRLLIAYFHQNSLLRLRDGSSVEVTFNSIPGKIFSAKLRTDWPASDLPPAVSASTAKRVRIPVLIDISDPHYAYYVNRIPPAAQAATAVYGTEFEQLAVVRKTLLRMSAWMNYLTPLS